MTLSRRPLLLALILAASLAAPQAFGFFVDGDGHYGLRGETETAPAFSKKTGTYQAIQQSFRLQGEARFNDLSSMFLEFRLFNNPRAAYLGDEPQARDTLDCGADAYGQPKPCPTEHQNTGEPGYKPYTPQVTKAYVRYAFDYCIVEAGRRGRDWGLGIFLDSGSKPFDTDASVFDGITCNINIQKTQTLGLSIGYDKLAETGSYVDAKALGGDRRFGANDQEDDLDQYFFTIEYDDRKANAGAAFTKQVGVYFAQISGHKLPEGSNTDLKFLDLYTGFFFADLSLRNEVLFRMGKSADPNWQAYGGAVIGDGGVVTNKLASISIAGSVDWTLSRSGAAIGPVEYNKGDATRHVIFFNYGYAPGDADGYRPADASDAKLLGMGERGDTDDGAKAIAFHRNYKPALLLFNARPEADRFKVDGAFNPGRMMNATMFATGYRYESMTTGDIEVKLITASLSQTAPADVKAYYNDAARHPGTDRPAGFYGKSLGYELDLTYTYKVGREAELGGSLAAASPGDAWKVDSEIEPTNDLLIQTFAAFHF